MTAEITADYMTGAIARCVELHARYYAETAGFGRHFEAKVAGGLAYFCERLDRPCNRLWLATEAGRILGSVAIDGEDLGSNLAHLRWFIVEREAQGRGIGRRLLAGAMAFCLEQHFAECHLWTFKGLDDARKLYEAHGFVLAEEWLGTQWGKEVTEQRMVRRFR
jgi:GNAT superfamily N-acetyltransferase